MKRDRHLTGTLRAPITVALVYAVLGCLWILFSDALLFTLVRDPQTVSRLETAKGWMFVAVTAVMLFFLVRRSVETARESEERFRLVVENTSDYEIFMLDPEGTILTWNLGAERAKGYSPEEIVGKHHSIFFTREDIAHGLPELELTTAQARGSFENEGWRVRKDGTRFWADVVTTVVRGAGGELRGYSKIVRDITDQKITEEKLKESEARYRVFAETASDAILTVDEESRILFANPAVMNVFGYSSDELIGRSLTMLMPERLRAGHVAGMRNYVETGQRGMKWSAAELPGLHRDGREVPLEVSYGAYKRNGRHFFTGIVRDIAERKSAEKEKEYKTMLERFNQELEILIAERTMNLMAMRVADKVRTPASVIGWTAKRLFGDEVQGRVRDGLSTIMGESAKLEMIVQEFHSLLKSRKPVFAYEDLNAMIQEVLPIIERESSSKGVSVELKLAPERLNINAQKELVRIAVFNLLRNAVEATPEYGRIRIETERVQEQITMTISDTGRAIPAEALERIFDPLSNTAVYRFGMGMPLVKQIVNEHLGAIEIRSDPVSGTEVKVSFPARWTGLGIPGKNDPALQNGITRRPE